MIRFLPVLIACVLGGSLSVSAEPYLPFVFHVERTDEGIVLQGSMPTKELRDSLVASVEKLAGEETVLDFTRFSPETIAEPWMKDLPDLVGEFLEIAAKGTDLSIVDGKLVLGGEAGSEEQYEALAEQLGQSPPGTLAFRDRLSVGGKRMVPDPEFFGPVEQPDSESAEGDTFDTLLAEVSEAVMQELAKLGEVEIATELGETDEKLTGKTQVALEPKGSEKKVKESTEQVRPTVVTVAAMEEEAGKPELKAEVEDKPEPLPSADFGDDPGGPLIFYFDVASSEIRSEDRHMIEWIAKRCERPRTIVYITGYADYRGSYALNRKLTIERTEKVRDAIFAMKVAEDLEAELEAKGDEQSESRDAWRAKDSEKSLQYSRRVVVETYHMK